MNTIELEPLDKKDLLEILEYAKSQKKIQNRNLKGWDDTRYWCMRIDQLKSIVNGYKTHGSFIQSSYRTIDCEMNQKEKNKMKYLKSLESDIEDVFDSED